MIAVIPIEGYEIQQREMLKRCVDVFFVSLNHEAVNVARTCRSFLAKARGRNLVNRYKALVSFPPTGAAYTLTPRGQFKADLAPPPAPKLTPSAVTTQTIVYRDHINSHCNFTGN
jgi:hypothetical protein